jgi:hypothetical protein
LESPWCSCDIRRCHSRTIPSSSAHLCNTTEPKVNEEVDDVDCRERFDRAWNKIIDGCPNCSMRLSSCRSELEPRYLRMFDDVPIHSTYLSFAKGSRYERNGRMVVYGLTSDEGDALCDSLRQQFQTRYTGSVACIRGRRD